MHLTMRAMNEFHRAAVAGTTTNASSMRARSACSNHMRCRVVKTLHQIPARQPYITRGFANLSSWPSGSSSPQTRCAVTTISLMGAQSSIADGRRRQIVEPLYYPWSIVDSFSSAAIEPQDREDHERHAARAAVFRLWCDSLKARRQLVALMLTTLLPFPPSFEAAHAPALPVSDRGFFLYGKCPFLV